MRYIFRRLEEAPSNPLDPSRFRDFTFHSLVLATIFYCHVLITCLLKYIYTIGIQNRSARHTIMTVVPLQPGGEEALRVSASMITLVFIALILRFIARFKARAGFLLEDGLALLAAAFFYVDQGLFLYAVLGKGSSGGSDATLMLLPQLDRFFRVQKLERLNSLKADIDDRFFTLRK